MNHRRASIVIQDDEITPPSGEGVERRPVSPKYTDNMTEEGFEGAVYAVELLLQEFGITAKNNPHLADTPKRVVKMYRELFYEEPWEFTTFPLEEFEPGGKGDPGIIVQRDIPVQSLCAHHMAPFVGIAHVAYIPKRRMVGLSKLARTIGTFSKGLCTQEEIGIQAADFLVEHLDPRGVAVLIECEHMCMTLRGVKAHQARTITTALRGVFLEDSRARTEVTALLTMSNGRV
jgi:GTP cyclohydrolase I